MFKDYRPEVHSRFYFQLYVLERTNHTSLKYILIDKRFTDEIKHRSSGQFCPELVTQENPTSTLRPPPIRMDTLVTERCFQQRNVGTHQYPMFTSCSAVSSTLTYLAGHQRWKDQLF